MKDLTKVPTPELLAEWWRIKKSIQSHEFSWGFWAKPIGHTKERLDELASELDRRCEGIRNVNGFPAFSDYKQLIYAKNDPNAREAIVNISIDELIERLKWLKLKPNV